MLSNKAFKIDHEESLKAVFDVCGSAKTSRSNKLAFLYGAKVALVNGGLPVECISRLEQEIAFYERNIDVGSESVQRGYRGAQEKANSGR